MIPRLSPSEALTRLREGYTYLDVRAESEFAEGHPASAVNVPWRVDGPIGTVPNEAFVDVVVRAFGRQARLVVGCHSGGRSAKAAAALASQGFHAIVEQRAGWDGARGPFGELAEPGWRRAGLERSTTGITYAALLASLAARDTEDWQRRLATKTGNEDWQRTMPERRSILQHIGRTPLVALARIGQGLPVPVLVKCEHMNPGGSIKDRIALAIVEDAERRAALRPGMTLIEATAGNTGLGLALVAAARGYALVCVMPEKMSVDKRVALAALGAKVVITPNAPPSSPDNFRNVAARMAEENGWFLTDQFRNPANVRVHEETTGAEILEQTGGRVGAFVAGAGTGGTLTGVGRRLKAANAAVRVVLADPLGSALADWVETGTLGPDGSYAVEGIGGSEAPANLHRDVIDSALRVSDEESFAMARRLAREEGLFVGGSAGTNVVAALRLAAEGGLDGPVVTVLPDSWDRYRAKPWMQAWTS